MPSLATIKLAIAGVILLAACTGTAFTVHALGAAKLARLKTDYALAQAAAADAARKEQAELDRIAAEADAAELSRQRAQLAATKARLAAVTRHVAAGKAKCVSWGLVRVIDAGALRRDADKLPLPGNAKDADCAPVDASALAGNILQNYAIAQANADRLAGCQDYLEKIARVKR